MSLHSIFFLRHYNDIDHISPVIWKWAKSGNESTVVLLDPYYEIDSDPRLQLVDLFESVSFVTIDDFLNVGWATQLFCQDSDATAENDFQTLVKYGLGKLGINIQEPSHPQVTRRVVRRGLREAGITVQRATASLTETDPDVCVFEWGPPLRYSHAEFFEAADRLDLPKVCLPHGLNIYQNRDIHPGRKRAIENDADFLSSRNRYDVYVSQSEYHKEQDVSFGVDPDRYRVLGSARYHPKWQQINQAIHEPFDASTDPAGRTKIVFMLPHWDYHVDRERTADLIKELVKHDAVYLVVKSHTRDETGLPADLVETVRARSDAEIIARIPSVSLIEWSDGVVNFGSSIGIEALLQEKVHINPTYLHENETIFDSTGAGITNYKETEVVCTIEQISQRSETPSTEDLELYWQTIYGGQEPHDVLGEYCNLLSEMAK